MSINTILIIITVISFVTAIFTLILEKKEVSLQKQNLSNTSSNIEKTQSLSDMITKTLELSSITKKVDVKHETASIDDNKEFRFKITLSLPAEEGENTGHALTSQIEDLDLLNTQYGTVEFVDGVGFFSLKNGETVNLYNIPIGFGYKIEEYDYSKEGYETIIDNGSGTIDSNEEIKVLVKNTYLLDFRNPETSSNFTLLLILSFGWLISLMLIVIRKKIKVARYS